MLLEARVVVSHVIGFSDLVDLWVIRTKKKRTYDPLRAYYVEMK